MVRNPLGATYRVTNINVHRSQSFLKNRVKCDISWAYHSPYLPHGFRSGSEIGTKRWDQCTPECLSKHQEKLGLKEFLCNTNSSIKNLHCGHECCAMLKSRTSMMRFPCVTFFSCRVRTFAVSSSINLAQYKIILEDFPVRAAFRMSQSPRLKTSAEKRFA